MQRKFRVARELRIPIDKFNYVKYTHEMEVSYSEEDLDRLSVIPSQEFKELEKTLDIAQRKAIMYDIGIEKLPMDDLKEEQEERKNRRKKLSKRRKDD